MGEDAMTEGEGSAAGKNQKQDEEEDRFGFIKWLYRWYKRYDTWSGRYDWFQWLLSMFKTHTATSLAITSGTAAVTVAAAVVVVNPDLRREYLPFLSAPTEAVQTQSWGSSVIYPIMGRDLEGRRATFDVAVLPQNLTWAQRSDRELDQGGTIISNSQVADTVFTPELREGLGRSNAVIAVGLASQEGQIEAETARALRRATTAAGWLASISGEEKPMSPAAWISSNSSGLNFALVRA
jgi:hypothetical protein